MRNGKIDVIIPAYNVQNELLFSCLSSIATQSLRESIKVTIVDDASTKENYNQIISCFSGILDIQILKMPKNGGPGVARQYGLDNTQNEFITFVDADDLLASGFALENLKNILIENASLEIAIGTFQELGYVNNRLVLLNHVDDRIWVFGKLYRRSFLNRYNIKFHPTSRANEDNGFNTLCRLSLADEKLIGVINEIVYYWHPTENSITRRNNEEYAKSVQKDGNFYGYIENMIYAINTSYENPDVVNKTPIVVWGIQVMLKIYLLYLEISEQINNQDCQIILSYCSIYYKEIYVKFRKLIDDNVFTQLYNQEMRNYFTRLIPTPEISITFSDFIDLIKD